MHTKKYPRIIVSNDDFLVVQGPDYPALFFSQQMIARGRTLNESPQPIYIRSCHAVGFIITMLEADAHVSAQLGKRSGWSPSEDLDLTFTLPSGFKAGYFSCDRKRRDSVWLRSHGFAMAVSPAGVSLTNAIREDGLAATIVSCSDAEMMAVLRKNVPGELLMPVDHWVRAIERSQTFINDKN